MAKPLLLIDGDILVYRSISAVEKVLEFEPDMFVMVTEMVEAKEKFRDDLDKILSATKIDDYHLCMSDKLNWRKDVYPDYKSNRKNVRKPMGFHEFRQWVFDNYPTISKPTLEADDILGILATKPGNNAVIWSIDKDLKQIPGKHLTDGKIVYVSPEDGDRLHILQTLTGDPVDGYPGCKGIGGVKAARLVDKLLSSENYHGGDIGRHCWPTVVETYEAAGLTEEFALSQARIARILRWDDWDNDKQQVKLWSPN
jgi:DNA polymerase-1